MKGGPLMDPTANDFASWLLQSPESQVVAGLTGFVLGVIVFGLLALVLR